jgi:hypothetical protein
MTLKNWAICVVLSINYSAVQNTGLVTRKINTNYVNQKGYS